MTLQKLLNTAISSIITPLVVLIVGLAVLFFLWGLLNYLKMGATGEAKGRDAARDAMVWGIIIITVMVSVWGLVKVAQSIFFGTNSPTSPPSIPQFNNSAVGTGAEPEGGGSAVY